MTKRDKWKKRPAVTQYHAFADALRAYTERVRYMLPDSNVYIEFEIPMPASWSKKKKQAMHGMPHQQKPDLDNLIKAVFDAMRGEDSGIWEVFASKRWGEKGSITFEQINGP